MYKLHTNPKDEKSVVYNLVIKYYKVGTPEEWLQSMDAIKTGDQRTGHPRWRCSVLASKESTEGRCPT
eukprot:609457-Ditylum_brightwellii.AAC.1